VCCGTPDPSELPPTKTMLILFESGGKVDGAYTYVRNHRLVDRRTINGSKQQLNVNAVRPSTAVLTKDMKTLVDAIPGHCEKAPAIIQRYRGKWVSINLTIGANGGPEKVLVNDEDISIDDCVAAVTENRYGIFPNYTGQSMKVSFPFQVK